MLREAPVSEQVRLVLPSLPRAERRVAISLLGDYAAAGLETVASLAARAGTSGPTVLLLASRLGFSGFAELRQALRDELTDRHASPLAQYGQRDLADGGRPTAGVQPELVETAGSVLLRGIESSFGRLNRDHVERSIGLLADRRHPVVTAGGRFSGLVARYLALHLQELRPGVTWAGELERMGTLLDIGRRHVVVVAGPGPGTGGDAGGRGRRCPRQPAAGTDRPLRPAMEGRWLRVHPVMT